MATQGFKKTITQTMLFQPCVAAPWLLVYINEWCVSVWFSMNVTQRWKCLCLFLCQTTTQTWWRWTGRWRSRPVKPWCCGATSLRSSSVLGTPSATSWHLGQSLAKASLLLDSLMHTCFTNYYYIIGSLETWIYYISL